MSLYGDLPPPVSTGDGDEGSAKKSETGAKDGVTPPKSALPAGWSSSVTRLKPLLNRKLVPPRAKPAQRSIPAGFVARSSTDQKHGTASNLPTTGSLASTLASNMSGSTTTAPAQAPAKAMDENSWLKERTAQVQRQDNDMKVEVALLFPIDIAFKICNTVQVQITITITITVKEAVIILTQRTISFTSVTNSRIFSQSVATKPRGESEQGHNQQREIPYRAFAPPASQYEPTPLEISNNTPVVMHDVSGEDAFLRRAQLSQQRPTATSIPPPLPPPQQRATQPAQQYNRTPFVPKTQPTTNKGTPSPVILLTNMVGPGEVDDTLQEETAAECEKFGAVVRCLIFEVQNGKVPPEEAVRIFVKFGTLTAAEKAIRELDRRFFGGRQVRGQFYDEKRFDTLQLAP
ncbi:hypothetical protein BG011_004917 [Mortierella polycephala]|uniref:RNA recognition motif domain-containing protein n=1 Tax=Mortierella polycephala TaxID=41804 RepID=A0A9P6PYL2_9FUNG|nr:hypothetical protein BG011_004917 [Mortierella polycephala]